MSAILKLGQIKNSLTDVFEAERHGFEIEIQPSNFQGYPGLLSSSYDEMISIDEFRSRKAELQSIRPDLIEWYWPIEEECILDYFDDVSKTVINPFVTTLTLSFEFETLDHLKSALLDVLNNTSEEAINEAKVYRASINNVIDHKVLVDGVDVTSTLDWFVDLR